MNDYSYHCRKRTETPSRAGTHSTERDIMFQSPRVPIIDHSTKTLCVTLHQELSLILV